MSETLTWTEARAVFRLLDELGQLGAEPLAWRRHLVEGLGAITGAAVALAGEVAGGLLLSPAAHVGTVDGGWCTDSDRRAWMAACSRTDPDLDPGDPAIAGLSGGSFTRARAELADDRAWRGSKMYNDHYRPAHLGDYLVSSVVVPELGLAHYLLAMKAGARAAFTPHEVALVRHLHEELGERWRRAARPGLAPRLRRTLALLEQGRSEKEVAAELGLSAHTVREYCKVLHRTFGVHSRGELLVKARALPSAPRLVLQDGA